MIIIPLGIYGYVDYRCFKSNWKVKNEIEQIKNQVPTVQINYLKIPRLKIYRKIFEGKVEAQLKQKRVVVWNARNDTNIYLVGHRIPSVFEPLKLIRKNDEIELYFHGQKMNYMVEDIKVIDEIEFPHLEDQKSLVLITCMEDDRKRWMVICRQK